MGGKGQSTAVAASERDAAARLAVLEAAVSRMTHGLVVTDRDGRVVVVNERYLAIYGLDPRTVRPGIHMRDLLRANVEAGNHPGASLDELWRRRGERLALGRESDLNQRLPDGRFVAVHFAPMPDGGWVSIHEDVTTQQRSQEALEAQSQRFDASVEHISHGFVMYDADQRLIAYNQRYLDMFGMSAEVVKAGATLREVFEHSIAIGNHPGCAVDEVLAGRERLIATGRPARFFQDVAGSRHVETHFSPMPGGGWLATFEDVTQRRRIEVVLEEQNRRFDAALANMAHGLAMFDADHRLIVFNAKFCSLHGFDPSAIRIGMSVRDVLAYSKKAGALGDEDVESAIADCLAIVARGEIRRIIRPLPGGRWIAVVINPTGDGGWLATYEDVTEQRRIEAALAEQNRRFDAALANMSQGLAMFDGQQKLIVRNDRYCELHGLDPAAVSPGVSLREIALMGAASGLHAEDIDALVARRTALVARGERGSFVQEMVDGRAISIVITPTGSGGWLATYEDVTQQRQIESERREHSRRLDAALANMSQGLAMYDADERLIVRNERYVELLNCDPSVIRPGATLREVFQHGLDRGSHPGLAIEEMLGRRRKLLASARPVEFIDVINGRSINIHLRPMPGGGWIATYDDLTDRLRMESDLRAQNLRFDAALENMSQGLAMFDADERLIVRNLRYCELFRLDPDRVIAGVAFRDILALAVESGAYVAGVVDALYRRRIDFVLGRERGSFLQELADGTTVSIAIMPMEGGGWVATYQDVTAARNAEDLIREQHGQFDAALDNMSDGLLMVDETFKVLVRNRRYCEIFGLTADETRPGLSLVDVIRASIARGNHDGTDAETMIAEYVARLERRGEHVSNRRLADGRTIEITNRRLARGGWVATYQDITAQLRAEEAIRQQNVLIDAALDNMAQGLCMIDRDFRVIVHNRRWRELFAIPAELARPGSHIKDLAEACVRRRVYHAGISAATVLAEMREVLDSDMAKSVLRQLADGRAIAVNYSPMTGGGLVATYEDVTERHRDQQRIAHLARHDVLTGLVNRMVLMERLQDALGAVAADGVPVAVLCIDLDKFKHVNDSFGHAVGDELLCQVVARLGERLRPGDTFARIGGDEFALLCRGTAPRVEALARRLVDLARTPFEIDRRPIHIGASIGIAIATEGTADASALMRNADLALYCAKAEGRSGFCFFRPEMDEVSRARRQLEADLRIALSEGAFDLHFQPQLDVATGAITGFEALLRWPHPVRGNVPPAEFIPLAEEIGLIGPIGEWVLRSACHEAARWTGGQRVAVNFSPAQFRDRGVVPMVVSALASAGLPTSRLEVEITESVLLSDDDQTRDTLRTLRDLGVRLALDDFGTGYSSLGLLRKIPLDKIKIDRSFVRDIGLRPDCAAIVRAIVGIGRDLGLRTTAEGVETEEQAAAVRELGCSELQGYLVGRPVPAEALGPFLAEGTTDTALRRTA